jgi:hypothetical protein
LQFPAPNELDVVNKPDDDDELNADVDPALVVARVDVLDTELLVRLLLVVVEVKVEVKVEVDVKVEVEVELEVELEVDETLEVTDELVAACVTLMELDVVIVTKLVELVAKLDVVVATMHRRPILPVPNPTVPTNPVQSL